MAIFVLDTNSVLRLELENDPLHQTVADATDALEDQGHDLRIASQNLVEAWNALTRPADRNGYGYTTAEADAALQALLAGYPLLADSVNVFHRWFDLVRRYNVQGVQVHDTRLIAILLENGRTHILTLNMRDFRRFSPEGIVVVDPSTVSSLGTP